MPLVHELRQSGQVHALPSECPGCGIVLTAKHNLVWTPRAILDACRVWTAHYGHPPTAKLWRRASVHHPAKQTVADVFGSWGAMVAAAGYKPRTNSSPWTRENVVDAFLDWVVLHGRWPVITEWATSTSAHPHSNTVRRLFGSWDGARRAAGYTGSARAKHATRGLPRKVAAA